MNLQFFLSLNLANSLSHSTHRAERTPGTGSEDKHKGKTDNGGSEHKAVEAEAELSHPISSSAGSVCPIPRNAESPQEFDCLSQTLCTGSNQIGLVDDVAEHSQEESKEAITEPLGAEELGRFNIAGTLHAAAKLVEKLTSAAVAVAESLAATDNGDEQRHKKIDHTQPSEKYVEKSKDKINNGPNPQEVIPMFFHYA